jgi:phosphonate dehydrogenase
VDGLSLDRSKIVVTARVFPETLELLARWGAVKANDAAEPWPREQLLHEARDATAILSFMSDWLDAPFLDACPRLRVVACALKGYDNYDVRACTERGVWLTTVPDLLTDATAELAVGLMLALARHILPGDAEVRAGRFHGWRPRLYGRSIHESVVGILGGGRIGKAIAARLSCFGGRTLVCDPCPSGSLPGNATWAEYDDVVRDADYLVLALPLEPASVHLVDAGFLERTKSGAFLVNVARGSLVDEAAVAEALRRGRLGGYAADVFEFEDLARPGRPSQIHPGLIAARDNTVLTPHLGSAVASVRRQIEKEAATNIAEVLSGRKPHGAVNELAKPRGGRS